MQRKRRTIWPVFRGNCVESLETKMMHKKRSRNSKYQLESFFINLIYYAQLIIMFATTPKKFQKCNLLLCMYILAIETL